MEASYDTDEEFRGLGIAEGATPEQAKENAYRVAMEQIMTKMPHHIKSVTMSYPDGSTYSETIVESSLTEEQLKSVAAWFAGGATLDEIQKRLVAEYGVHLTYFDLRMVVADLPQPEDPEDPTDSMA
jgi:hypothetical protein